MTSPSNEGPESAAATAAEVDAFMDQEMKKDQKNAAASKTEETTAQEETTQSPSEIPPGVAALDQSLAPYLKAVQLRNQYIAVRVGYAVCHSCLNAPQPPPVKAVRNAIFFSWEDAKQFVEFEKLKVQDAIRGGGEDGKTLPFYSNVEWEAFDRLDKAETNVTAAPEQKKKHISMLKKRAAKKKIQAKHIIVTAKSPPRNRGPPTKKWMQMHDLAKAYKSTHGNLEVSSSDTENATLHKWIKYQRDSYRSYLEDPIAGQHSMTDEKVKILSELGFTWIQEDKQKFIESGVESIKNKKGRPRKDRSDKTIAVEEEDDDDGTEKSQGIRQKWMEMFEKLKAYVKQHDSTDIPKDTEDDDLVALRTWCSAQKSQYSMLQKGKSGKGLTTEKIDLLKSIGFNFPPNWSVMFNKLVEFKKLNGHTRVAQTDDSALAKWVASQNEVLGRHLQGKCTRLSEQQVMKLMGIGLIGGRRSIEVQDLDAKRDAKWNEMYLKLVAYKAENGHANPPTTDCNDLSNWVAAQRRMYTKLIQGKPGKRAVLDAVKMQRLTEIGFAFRPRGDYLTWDDQIERLQKFKDENGHCKVPVNHPVLGGFVKLARREYKLKQQGKKSSMTEARENELLELGFVFEGGKTPKRSEGGNKSWDERFEELLQFKEENGHTVVPQNSGRLGQWVHSQRVGYKKMKEGKPTSMTAEKALKLTEVGFCFNASDRFRGNKSEDKTQTEYAPMYPGVPQLPPAEYAWRGNYE